MILTLWIAPVIQAQDLCCEDQKACETLLDEESSKCASLADVLKIVEADNAELISNIKDLEVNLATCEKSNDNDGDISLADLFKYIPGFAKLENKTQALIISIGLGAVALGLSYIPPPNQ